MKYWLHNVANYTFDYAQNALQREWGNFPFANWNGICWGLPLQLVQLIKIHFLPHLESFMWERKFEKKFFKKSHIQNPNGVLLIFKLPFPNGSYHNGVCRALWAKSGCKKHASFEFAAIKRGAEEDFSLNHFFFACAQSHGIVALPGAHKAAICIRLWQSPKGK